MKKVILVLTAGFIKLHAFVCARKNLIRCLAIAAGFFSGLAFSGNSAGRTPPDQGRVCILVHSSVYPEISSSLDQYQTDLEYQGFSSVLYQYTSGTAAEVRSFLASLYAEPESLKGAVLVGAIPYVLFDDGGVFPTDLFFEDLNGTWTDTDGDGRYETHEGDRFLEIWVSRLKVDTLPMYGSESSILNAYFSKNHRYRVGQLVADQKALIYLDGLLDAAVHPNMTPYKQALEKIYGVGNVTVFKNKTASYFKKTLMTKPYELVLSASDGSPTYLTLYSCSFFGCSSGTVTNNDFASINPQWLFYIMAAPGACNYTANNYLCGASAFNPADSGLLIGGSAKKGGSASGSEIYYLDQSLLEGPLGEAFKVWFNNLLANPKYAYQPIQNYYGVVFLGDWTLQLKMSWLDYDNDALTNADEFLNGTDPFKWDSDNGGEADGSEVAGLRDPLDATDDLAAPTNLQAIPIDGAMIVLFWEKSPALNVAQYNLYWNNGTGAIKYVNPLATIPALSPLTFTTVPLTVGQNYCFVARTQLATGVEEQNTQMACAVPFNSSAGKVQACIKHPGSGKKFNGNLLLVKAEVCVGSASEVSQVLLQWRPAGGGAWSNVLAADGRPNPDPSDPYFVNWDVSGLGNGVYQLRAVAYNLSLQADLDPPVSEFGIDQEHPDRAMRTGANGLPEVESKAYTNVATIVEISQPGLGKTDRVEIPEGALQENNRVTAAVEDHNDHDGKVSGEYQNPGQFKRVTLELGQDDFSNGKQAELIWSYADADQDGLVDGTGIEESELRVYAYDGPSGQWEMLEGIVVEPAGNRVRGKTGHFSLFALLDDRDNDKDALIDQDEDMWGTDRNNPDSDGDTLPDGWEVSSSGCGLNPLGDDSLADPDSDNLTNGQEYLNSTLPCDADTDNDTLTDGDEVNLYFTNPLSPDTDTDLMPDVYEVAIPCLDPLLADGATDFDGDGLENVHEYYNDLSLDGNTSDPCDDTKPRRGLDGGGYFGDGDGDLIIGSTDLSKINLKLNGRSVDYLNVFPADPVIQDMDGDLIIGSTDKSILSLILNAKQTDFIAGTPTALALEPPLPPATMQVGETVRIKVKLTNDKGNPSAGFGVVFDVVSGSATLLGGEGGPVTPEYSSASRWDLTALDGIAQMVVRADAAGPIVIHTELPYDGDVHTRQVILSPDIQINVNP